MSDRSKRIRDDIARSGWHVILVPEDEEGPGFGYSIGLFQTYGHPEVIVFGQPLDVLHGIVNAIGEAIGRGRHLKVGDESDQVLEEGPVTFRAVAEERYDAYLGQAIRHYGGKTFPVIQCFWPTRDGLWPWQEGCPAEYVALQPSLRPPDSFPS